MWHLYLLFKLLYSLYPDSCSNFVLRWTPWGLGFSRCRVPACEKILQGSCSVAEHPQKIPRFWIKVSFEGACIRKWQWCHEMSVPSTTHWALSMYSINWQHFSSYFLHLLLVFQNISMLFEPSMKFERLPLKSLSSSRALCRFTHITFSYLPVSGPRISGGWKHCVADSVGFLYWETSLIYLDKRLFSDSIDCQPELSRFFFLGGFFKWI